MSIKTMSAPRRSPRLAALRSIETELRRSPRLANNRVKAIETELRRSPRLAKVAELRRSPRLAKLRDSIAEAKDSARADQAERAEMTLRRSVRINRPSDEPLLRWQAFLVDIEQENTVITADEDTLYTASDTDYEETISDLSDTDYGETDTETDSETDE